MCIFNYAKTSLFDFLDSPVREYALLFSVAEKALDRSIWEADLFRSVWEVFLNLIVLEFENLETIRESGLGSFSIREEIHNLASGEGLLDILILKEDNLVAIWPHLSFDSVREGDFFFAAFVELLLFAL